MNTEISQKKYHITTFGCQMNVSDSERVASVAESLGFSPTEDINNADLIIINSCSIRQKAEDRVMGMGKRINKLKEDKEIVTVLTGCMAKREDRASKEKIGKSQSEEKYENGLKKVMPWLDYVVEIKEMHKLGNYLGLKSKVDASEYLSIKPKSNQKFTAWLPISTGCNKFCTYCIVPFSRGPEIYRPYIEILKEVEEFLNSGVKEITLLGQNVNSWRGFRDENRQEYIESKDPHRLLKAEMPEGMIDFADLIYDIGQILDKYMDETENKIWLRFTSAHPYDIDEKLIDVVKKHKSIAKQFHFALQSGSNAVLKRMNRHYNISDFEEKYNLIRNEIPEVGISTDIIVGFCGETEEEFAETEEIMKKLKFDQAFLSEYSTRKGTIADRVYKDNVSHEVKTKRKEILNEILAAGNKERNEAMVGKEYEVLVYKKNKLGFVARTESSKDVLLKEENLKIGEFLKVKITECDDWGLKGELILKIPKNT